MNWVASFFGILGALLVSFKSVYGWYAWLIGNTLWIIVGWDKDWGSVIMFSVYNVVCINALFQWRKKK